MLAILGELCWFQFFKTVYLETSNVRFGSFFQNPVTYNLCTRYLYLYTRASEPGWGGGLGPWPSHYCQKHVLALPLFGPTSQSAKAMYTHTKKYLHTRSHTTITQKHSLGCGITSPPQLSSHSLYCIKHKTCNFIPVMLACDICCSNISWIQCSEKFT